MNRSFTVFVAALVTSAASTAAQPGHVSLSVDSAKGEAKLAARFAPGAQSLVIDMKRHPIPADGIELGAQGCPAITKVEVNGSTVEGKNDRFDVASGTLRTVKVALDKSAGDGCELSLAVRASGDHDAEYADLQVYGGIHINGNNNTVNVNGGYGQAGGVNYGGYGQAGGLSYGFQPVPTYPYPGASLFVLPTYTYQPVYTYTYYTVPTYTFGYAYTYPATTGFIRIGW